MTYYITGSIEFKARTKHITKTIFFPLENDFLFKGTKSNKAVSPSIFWLESRHRLNSKSIRNQRLLSDCWESTRINLGYTSNADSKVL